MGEIKVELKYWSGDDLAVIAAAKESFNRKAEWEYEWDTNGTDEYHEKRISEGWEWEGDCDEGGQKYKRLKIRDQDLMRMLSRGMGQSEFDTVVNQLSISSDPEAIKYWLWKFRHTTPHLAPFGHCFATFRFRAPVFVMRHVQKHEYLRISELSMRYVRGMPEYFRPKSWRAMAEDVKQGSGGEHEMQDVFFDNLDFVYEEDKDGYDGMLGLGMAPEQARTFLRLCHMTEGTISGSMDAIAGLVIKRLDPHAQEETREFARQVDKQMAEIYPLAWAALTEGVVR